MKPFYDRLPNDQWIGLVDGIIEIFTVVGVSGNNPVIRCAAGQRILDWETGRTL